MAQVRALVGHASVEMAKRKRKCWRHKNGQHAHDIAKDETCLVIKENDGGKANYCLAAASEILDRAERDLALLRAELGL